MSGDDLQSVKMLLTVLGMLHLLGIISIPLLAAGRRLKEGIQENLWFVLM